MADRRYYARFDVGYLSNPKIAPLLEHAPRAVLLHSWAILYSKQHGTDGVVPIRLGMREVWIDRCSEQCGEQCQPQCNLGMLLENGLLQMVDGATAIVHDYLEHQDSSESMKRASDKGKRAAEARWGKPKDDAPSNASSNAQGNASGNAKERRGEESNTRSSDSFEAWWLEYPRKVGKGQARPAYKRALAKASAEVLLAASKRYAERVATTEPRFIAHPTTWLNGERWLDAKESIEYALTQAEQMGWC